MQRRLDLVTLQEEVDVCAKALQCHRVRRSMMKTMRGHNDDESMHQMLLQEKLHWSAQMHVSMAEQLRAMGEDGMALLEASNRRMYVRM